MIFDSHAHYNDSSFDADRNEIIENLPSQNVELIMNACSSLAEMEDIISLCKKYPFIYGSVGIHPECAEIPNSELEKKITRYAQIDKIKAIGEIGLDYHYDDIPREIQKECFDFQIKIANKLNMPIIVHDREAHKDSLDIVKANSGARGVFHCFSGSTQMAREVMDLGFFIAFGGSLTFKNNIKTVECAKYVPLDMLVVETDCPYLTPVPYRGKRNSSDKIRYVIDKIAEIKGIDSEIVENAAFENAKKLYEIEV